MNRGPVNKCVKSSGDFLLGSGLNSDCIFKLCPQIEVPGEVRIFRRRNLFSATSSIFQITAWALEAFLNRRIASVLSRRPALQSFCLLAGLGTGNLPQYPQGRWVRPRFPGAHQQLRVGGGPSLVASNPEGPQTSCRSISDSRSSPKESSCCHRSRPPGPPTALSFSSPALT